MRRREQGIKERLLEIKERITKGESDIKKKLAALGWNTIQDEIKSITDDVETLTDLIDSIKRDLNELQLNVGPLIG